jgi:hypothetical protein
MADNPWGIFPKDESEPKPKKFVIKLPTSDWGRFFFYFTVQFISYFLIVANGRAYVQGSYAWTTITDGLLAAQAFLLFRKMAQDSQDDIHGLSMAGYVLGGVAGSNCAILVTKLIYGA